MQVIKDGYYCQRIRRRYQSAEVQSVQERKRCGEMRYQLYKAVHQSTVKIKQYFTYLKRKHKSCLKRKHESIKKTYRSCLQEETDKLK